MFTDYGQDGSPLNPCGDPPGGAGAVLSPPTAEGGALRSQDLRTAGDPTGLSGSVIRVDPQTGLAPATNPLVGSADPNARRIVAQGLRNPFRFTFRPGTSELWIGDVGWGDFEEVNRILSPTDAVVENFGWPCYEGSQRQSGYDAANLAICETLYGDPSGLQDRSQIDTRGRCVPSPPHRKPRTRLRIRPGLHDRSPDRYLQDAAVRRCATPTRVRS